NFIKVIVSNLSSRFRRPHQTGCTAAGLRNNNWKAGCHCFVNNEPPRFSATNMNEHFSKTVVYWNSIGFDRSVWEIPPKPAKIRNASCYLGGWLGPGRARSQVRWGSSSMTRFTAPPAIKFASIKKAKPNTLLRFGSEQRTTHVFWIQAAQCA